MSNHFYPLFNLTLRYSMHRLLSEISKNTICKHFQLLLIEHFKVLAISTWSSMLDRQLEWEGSG